MRLSASTLVALIALGSPLGGTGIQLPLPVVFSDATAEVELRFRHHNGGFGERYMVETMGSGLAAADLDADGWLDVYLAQGALTPGGESPPVGGNMLLRGHPSGRFITTPPSTGVESEAWSLGVAAADYDDDGYTDIYVTNLGPNQLFRNNGDGSFSEVGAAVGVDDQQWGASAAWGDIDNDGHLDLYVTNYVDFAWDNHKFCGNLQRNLRAYCHPDVYGALADRLYRNQGDGNFVDIAAQAGVADTVDGKDWESSSATTTTTETSTSTWPMTRRATSSTSTTAMACLARMGCWPGWPSAPTGKRREAWARTGGTSMVISVSTS